MLRGGKGMRRVSPEQASLTTAAQAATNSSTTAQDLQETITIQARAIREMTSSLEKASSLMEKQSDTFTNEIDLLNITKNQLEKKVSHLESRLKSRGTTSNRSQSPAPPSTTPPDTLGSTSGSTPGSTSGPAPDAVEAAEFMAELDEMIQNLGKLGQTKSLPSIVRHLLTLFRYVFPAELIEMVVLDPYSDGVYWSMFCRTEYNPDDAMGSVFFDDSSGEKVESALFAEVLRTRTSVVIKDGEFSPGNGQDAAQERKQKARSSKRMSIMGSGSQQPQGTAAGGGSDAKRTSSSSSSDSTARGATNTRYMVQLEDTTAVSSWKDTQTQRMASSNIQSAIIVPVMDRCGTKVLAIFQIVNRLNPSDGTSINFSNKDLELLKLFLNRTKQVFRLTRTLTGLLSAARSKHGSLLKSNFTVRSSFEGGGSSGSEEVKETVDGKTSTTLEQQLSQTKAWLKDQLLHRDYQMIFQVNPRIEKKLNVFIVTLKALSKFLKTLARLRASKRKSFQVSRKASILSDLNTFQVMTLNFDDFSVSSEVLEEHAYNMLDMCGVIKQWHAPPDRLKLFIKRVSDAYLDNPYHCWAHGFMVMRTTCIVVRDCPYIELSTYELGSICIAAMCHDLAHPGKNNAFESKINSPLAIRYNDKSIYENMHAATTFEILSDPAADVFLTLTTEKRAQMRKMMIQSILMTDMASHFELAKKLEAKVADDQVAFSKDVPEDKQLLLDLIVHSCDIGGMTLPVPIALKWSQAVLVEFQEVHEAEKAANVDLTPFIIGLDEPLRAANCQFGFANFIVKPLWSNVVKICSEEKKNEILFNLNGNVQYWKSEVDKHTPSEPEQAAEGGEAKGESKDESKDEGKDEGKDESSTAENQTDTETKEE